MENIVKKFNVEGQLISITPLLNGLINKTYLVETTKGKYLLQKINKYVFTNPIDVMNNIVKITNHIKKKNKKTLDIVKSNACYYYYDELNSEYYRMYYYMNGCCNVEVIDNRICREVGKAIGEFQYLLFDFDPNDIVETITNFHQLSSRIEQLKNAYDKLAVNDKRKVEVKELYDYIVREYEKNKEIDDKICKGIIPIRIVHNDTKTNNVMFDKNNKAVAMIDLDTVMPGTILSDYGDVIRSTVCNADENETNLSLVSFDDTKFVSLTTGYLSKMYYKLTFDEINELVNAVGVITLECSSRFLTDYLNYDKYFRIDYPTHNIDRAINQITLYKDYLNKKNKWKKIVLNIYKKLMINK